jgi:hypothetical protein
MTPLVTGDLPPGMAAMGGMHARRDREENPADR